MPALAQDYFPSVNPFTVPRDPALYDQAQQDPNLRALRDQAIAEGTSQLDYYNIKMGPVLAWFRAGMMFRYQSNFNLVSDANSTAPEGNFTIGPALSGSLRYDISEKARLMLSAGLTYQWSLNNNQDQLVFSPASSVDYQFGIGEVQFSLFDNVATASTAVTDPTISGTGESSLMNFNRLDNNVGLGAVWPAFKDTTVSSGYSFGIFRGLNNDNFNQLDRNNHTFNLGVQHVLNPVWTVGLSSQGNMNHYIPNQVTVDTGGVPTNARGQVQNDNYGWGVGPTASWQITQFIALNGLVNYTVQNFQQDGLISDSSNFSGITFNLSLSHIINQYLRQTFTGGRSMNPGNGSNFTQQTTMGYQLRWQITQLINLTTNFRFSEFEQSGAGFAYLPFDPANPPTDYLYITDDGIVVVPLNSGQQGQQYVLGLGTGFDLTQKLSLGVNYGLAVKSLSNQLTVNTGQGGVPYGDYITQSIVLSLAYKF